MCYKVECRICKQINNKTKCMHACTHKKTKRINAPSMNEGFEQGWYYMHPYFQEIVWYSSNLKTKWSINDKQK